ncbi:hypothetical protein N7486_009982 [Penicillium sp. IBT 16267x]|nr:hypothetical protein N7486_009982 [Penicillium sp. IBT 16267x]
MQHQNSDLGYRPASFESWFSPDIHRHPSISTVASDWPAHCSKDRLSNLQPPAKTRIGASIGAASAFSLGFITSFALIAPATFFWQVLPDLSLSPDPPQIRHNLGGTVLGVGLVDRAQGGIDRRDYNLSHVMKV